MISTVKNVHDHRAIFLSLSLCLIDKNMVDCHNMVYLRSFANIVWSYFNHSSLSNRYTNVFNVLISWRSKHILGKCTYKDLYFKGFSNGMVLYIHDIVLKGTWALLSNLCPPPLKPFNMTLILSYRYRCNGCRKHGMCICICLTNAG